MTYIDPNEVHADVERAIERHEYEGGSESVCDVLQAWPPTPETRLKPRFVSEPPDFFAVVRREGGNEKSGF
jgi:hypothetical protein